MKSLTHANSPFSNLDEVSVESEPSRYDHLLSSPPIRFTPSLSFPHHRWGLWFTHRLLLAIQKQMENTRQDYSHATLRLQEEALLEHSFDRPLGEEMLEDDMGR